MVMPLQRENERLLDIIRIQTDVARLGPDLGGVMSLVVERTLNLVGADGSAIELAEFDEMVYRAAAGTAARFLGLRLSRATSLSGLSVASATPLRCDDSDIDPRADREACRKVGLRSMIVVPLKHAGVTVGVLKAMSAEVARFDDDDVATLGLLSELVGSCMYYSTRFAADDLFHRATHDALTDLPNRSLFMDRLRNGLAQSARDGRPIGLLMIDMDGLKPINDDHGHRAGDAVLVEFGRRLATCARQSDTVARLGGDEFALILAPAEQASGVHAVLERIEQKLAPAFAFGATVFALRASIGAAEYPADARELDALIELADQRMYDSKRRRRQELSRSHS